MLRRIGFIITLCVLGSLAARAQYDMYFSHYWDMETSFNPGAAGKEAKLNVVGAYAMTMAGFRRNPNTFFAGGDMPFYAMNSYHGVGLNLLNDQLGLFKHQRVAAQYAHKRKVAGGTLSAGVQVGFINETFDGSDLDLEDSSDPAFTSGQLNGSTIDLAFGLYYTHKRWYAGLSAQHLTAPLVELGERNELQIDRTYYLTGGYNIKLRNPFLSIPTSVLARTDAVAWRADVTARLVYSNDKKHMYAGFTYSPTNSVTVLIGGSVQGFNLGYSYEVYTSAISPANGSHELFVGYQQDINLYKKGKNKHKSVRYL
ncbi:MAG: type IX secretion system membrane protein PorP/SprF [Prevotella sp.]|nr:type IX secretion system membrane protein PorP/SprF [Prevotella sp.]